MLTETKKADPLLICYLRKCRFWSLCILQLIPLNDKGLSVLLSPCSLLPPKKKRKIASCFGDIWVSETRLFWVTGLIIRLRWGEQPWLPPGDLAFGFPQAAVPSIRGARRAVPASAAGTGCVVDLPAWKTLILCFLLVGANETNPEGLAGDPPGHRSLSPCSLRAH